MADFNIPPSSMFLAHVDAVLGSDISAREPYNAQKLAREVINLYAIFHDHLVIGDVSTLYNEPLRDMLLGSYARHHHHYEKLLEDGTILVSRRGEVKSFKELDRLLRERPAGTYGAFDPGIGRDFADFLDDSIPQQSIIEVDTAHLGESFTLEARKWLGDREKLSDLGLGAIADPVIEYLHRKAPSESKFIRRSYFFDLGEKLQLQENHKEGNCSGSLLCYKTMG
jgi:hypothetical protein